MKKLSLLIMPIMAISLLASCGEEGSKPIDEFTIIIENTAHFTPEEYTFTFKKDHFDPIEVSYTVDENFAVFNTKTDSEKSYCNFDAIKNKLFIYPQENKDFKINVSVTSIDQVSSVTIVNIPDEYMSMDVTSINFKKGNHDQIFFPFVIEDDCFVAASVLPDDSAHVEVKNNTIIVTPKLDVDINITPFVTKYKEINFNALGGKLEEGARPSIKIPYGKTWGEYVDKTTQIASRNEMDFKGWSFDSSGVGKPIQDDMVIGKDTPSTVYAIYYHHISLESLSLEIKNLVYKDSYLFINVRLKDADHFDLPHEDKIEISNSGKLINFEYLTTTKIDASFKIETIYLTSETVYIKVTDNQPAYDINFSLQTGLKHAEEVLFAKKGENYKFKLYADNQNEEVYYISDYLTITLTDSEGHQRVLDDDAYHVEPKDDSRQEADVTIFGNYVKGDLKIEATPLRTDAYYYNICGHGIRLSSDETTWDYNFYGYHQSSEELIFHLDPELEEPISTSNIVVTINDNEYYLLAATPEKYTNLISYRDASVYINSHSLDTINSIRINIYHPNYKDTFETENWNIISALSDQGSMGTASALFSVGQERKIIMPTNNITYTLRIIGIYHDHVPGRTKCAGLTIEFEELVSSDFATPYLGNYDDDEPSVQCGYSNSTYENYLNITFRDKVPTELKKCMKRVYKPCYNSSSKEIEDFEETMFALSLTELNATDGHLIGPEGEPYEFYKNTQEPSVQERRKKAAIGGDSIMYWTRSVNSMNSIFTINENGDVDFRVQDKVELGYIAAFCI